MASWKVRDYVCFATFLINVFHFDNYFIFVFGKELMPVATDDDILYPVHSVTLGMICSKNHDGALQIMRKYVVALVPAKTGARPGSGAACTALYSSSLGLLDLQYLMLNENGLW